MGAPWQQIVQEIGTTVHALENAGLSAVSNAKAFARSNKTYRKMRNDAILDREHEEWYNSPAQQIRRLQEAGLNPNLVYGSGASAGMAGNTRESKQVTPASSFINAFQNTDFIDNMVKMKGLEMMQEKNRAEVALLRGKALEQGERNMRLARENLYDTTSVYNLPDTYSGQLRKEKYGLLNYQRLGAYQGMLLRKYEADLQKSWKQYGVTGNDNFFIRAGAKALDKFDNFINSLDWDSFGKFFGIK